MKFSVFVRSIIAACTARLVHSACEDLIVAFLIEIVSFEVSKEPQIVLLAMGHSKKKDSFIVSCEWSTF